MAAVAPVREPGDDWWLGTAFEPQALGATLASQAVGDCVPSTCCNLLMGLLSKSRQVNRVAARSARPRSVNSVWPFAPT